MFYSPMNLFRGNRPILQDNLNLHQKLFDFFRIFFNNIFAILLIHNGISTRLLVVPRLIFISKKPVSLNPLEMKAFVSCILYWFGH